MTGHGLTGCTHFSSKNYADSPDCGWRPQVERDRCHWVVARGSVVVAPRRSTVCCCNIEHLCAAKAGSTVVLRLRSQVLATRAVSKYLFRTMARRHRPTPTTRLRGIHERVLALPKRQIITSRAPYVEVRNTPLPYCTVPHFFICVGTHTSV